MDWNWIILKQYLLPCTVAVIHCSTIRTPQPTMIVLVLSFWWNVNRNFVKKHKCYKIYLLLQSSVCFLIFKILAVCSLYSHLLFTILIKFIVWTYLCVKRPFFYRLNVIKSWGQGKPFTMMIKYKLGYLKEQGQGIASIMMVEYKLSSSLVPPIK